MAENPSARRPEQPAAGFAVLSTAPAPARKLFAAAIVVLACLVALPRAGHAVELGLTPSHVFSLWTNINNCLLAAARTTSGGAAQARELAALTPGAFAGKRPADVLGRVQRFRAKLDLLRAHARLAPVERFELADGEVTPSAVYLNSGHVLNGLVEWLIANTGPGQLVSPFYARHKFDGKSPSDVFALVDLAERRLDRILAGDRG